MLVLRRGHLHTGLFAEVLARRSINGRKLPDGILVLAALNPYRMRKDSGASTPGLVFQLHGTAATVDPMRALVYRVHPVPATLQGFIFDFGSLTSDMEKLYVESMAASTLKTGSSDEHKFIAAMIQIAQEFVRTEDGDSSAASLRDVKRCLNLINFFDKNLTYKKEPAVAPLGIATTLALAFTYLYRLPSSTARTSFLTAMRYRPDWKSKLIKGRNWDKLGNNNQFNNIIESAKKKFCDNIEVEDGIAMNFALQENIFVVLISILNKIPVMLVGKPGSSKTLVRPIIKHYRAQSKQRGMMSHAKL